MARRRPPLPGAAVSACPTFASPAQLMGGALSSYEYTETHTKVCVRELHENSDGCTGGIQWSHTVGEPVPFQLAHCVTQDLWTSFLSECDNSFPGSWHLNRKYLCGSCLGAFILGFILGHVILGVVFLFVVFSFFVCKQEQHKTVGRQVVRQNCEHLSAPFVRAASAPFVRDRERQAREKNTLA